MPTFAERSTETLRLHLRRRLSCGGATIGELSIGGAFECFTLEDVVRPAGEKVPGQTAIPAGAYRVTITMSPRFGRLLPLLLDVPGFTGIRIHPGNTAADTEGCILVGRTCDDNAVSQSRAAFDALFARLVAAQGAGIPIMLEIENA